MNIKSEKILNSTTIPNELLLDETISDKARGLLVRMLSRPCDYKFDIPKLIDEGKSGNSAVRSAIKELESQHYVHRFSIRKNGKIAWVEYVVCDKPMSREKAEDLCQRHYGNRGEK